MDRCKECFDEFAPKDLIYPERGYPYCQKCFDGKLSLYQKRDFKMKFKKDERKRARSLKQSEASIQKVMGYFQSESDRMLGKLRANHR